MNDFPEEPRDTIIYRMHRMPAHTNVRKRIVSQPSKCPTGKGRAWEDEKHGWVFISEAIAPGSITDDDIFRVSREDLVDL